VGPKLLKSLRTEENEGNDLDMPREATIIVATIGWLLLADSLEGYAPS